MTKFKQRLFSAGISVVFQVAFGATAIAQGPGGEPPRGRPPEMTAAQKKCFTDNGVEAPGGGKPPTSRPDRAVMEKVKACLKENGLSVPDHGPGGPGGPGGGHPPGPPPERSD